jgi:hypothetical protein
MEPREFPLWLFVLVVMHGFLAHKRVQRSNLIVGKDKQLDPDLETLNLTAQGGGSTMVGWNTSPALKNEREWKNVPDWILIFEVCINVFFCAHKMHVYIVPYL